MSAEAKRRYRVRAALRGAGCTLDEVDKLAAGVLAAVEGVAARPEPVKVTLNWNAADDELARALRRIVRRDGGSGMVA